MLQQLSAQLYNTDLGSRSLVVTNTRLVSCNDKLTILTKVTCSYVVFKDQRVIYPSREGVCYRAPCEELSALTRISSNIHSR